MGAEWRTLFIADGWGCAVRHEASKWQQVKVWSTEPVPHKANYWVAWNGERFANGTEAKLLAKRKGLFERVERALKSNGVCGTLVA